MTAAVDTATRANATPELFRQRSPNHSTPAERRDVTTCFIHTTAASYVAGTVMRATSPLERGSVFYLGCITVEAHKHFAAPVKLPVEREKRRTEPKGSQLHEHTAELLLVGRDRKDRAWDVIGPANPRRIRMEARRSGFPNELPITLGDVRGGDVGDANAARKIERLAMAKALRNPFVNVFRRIDRLVDAGTRKEELGPVVSHESDHAKPARLAHLRRVDDLEMPIGERGVVQDLTQNIK